MSELIVSKQKQQAVELHQKIIVSAQLAQQNLYDMCTSLKQMRDNKLYKELGYSNFEDYCENEVGFNRTQAHKYISIVENTNENVYLNKQIGVTKLYLLSTISEGEQQQIAEKVNLEDTTVKELKAEIEKLKKRAENAELHKQNAQNAYERLEKTNKKHYENYCTELKKNQELKEEIKELESRPIEVAVEENPELTYELKNAKATIKQLDRQLSEADVQKANEVMKAIRDTWNKANQEKQEEIEDLKAEYEQKLSEQQNSNDSVDEVICNMQKMSIRNAQSALIKSINEAKKLKFIYKNEIRDELKILLDGITDMLKDL